MIRHSLAAALLLCAALAGCVSAPDSRGSRSGQATSEWGYRVRPGDTLSAIAGRYRVDMRTLAWRNRLSPPYVIRVGQILAIPARGRAAPAGNYVSRPVVQPVPPPQQAYAPQRPFTPAAPLPPPYAPPRPASGTLASAPRLTWPVDGQLVEAFGSGRTPNRISVAAHPGTAVRAAAGGTVRLVGVGEVLVEHGNGWITAYGNLGKLVVTDGERVPSGARLGFVRPGMSGISFELRSEGAAIDPLPLLPPRL